MDFMNLNQSAHGGREYGFILSRLRRGRKVIVGFWKDEEELRTHWRTDREWQPQMEESTREELYRGWNKAVQKSLDWID